MIRENFMSVSHLDFFSQLRLMVKMNLLDFHSLLIVAGILLLLTYYLIFILLIFFFSLLPNKSLSF